MTDSPELARLAARALRGAIENVPAPPSDPSPELAIAGLRAAIAARAARKRRQRLFGGLAAAAATLILVGAGAAGVVHLRGHASDPAATWRSDNAGDGVAAGGHIVTEGSDVKLSLTRPAGPVGAADGARRTEVVVGARSEVALVEQGRANVFRLERGTFSAKVAKLGPDERFVVRTGDAEVEVRGTAFEVSVVPPDPSCGGGTTTRLRVTEGKVAVRHQGAEVLVPAGESWPVCAASSTATAVSGRVVGPAIDQGAPPDVAPPSTPSASNPVAPTPTSAKVAVADPSAPHAAPTPASNLSEQNDLFAEGVSAKRRGDSAGAIAAFDKLTSRYPGGPLTESAAVERMKVLEGVDRSAARAAANAYLRRYPRGFGRADAEALLARTAP